MGKNIDLKNIELQYLSKNVKIKSRGGGDY